MKEPRHGITLKREDTKYKPEDPGYEKAGNTKGILKHWADTWEDWIGDLAGEFKTAIREYPEAKDRFEEAKACWDAFGKAVSEGAGDLLRGLNDIYHPDPKPPSNENRDILTDATNPPPPPFGKGRDDGDEMATGSGHATRRPRTT